MRLRKTMKRTAAAVLALSMAVSAVAAPASAAYICDVSKGNVEVSVDTEGNKSIKVGGVAVEKSEDDSDDIIITGDNTGDNTKPTESQNAEEENTSEVEKSGENTSEVEKSGETEGEGKTQNSAAENKEQAEEPGSLELLAPGDEQKETDQKKDEQKPAETQETEQDKKTEKTSDQVIEYGQYDPEAQQEATKLVAKQETQEKKAAEEKTYGDTNAPTTLSEGVQTAARNVVKIINDSKETLTVILRKLKVDAGKSAQDAMTVSGTGDVTLELDGKNELTGGSEYKKEDDYSYYRGGHGLDSGDMSGVLRIQDENEDKGTLTAIGGSVETNDLKYSANRHVLMGGSGINATSLVLSGVTVEAEGGSSTVNKDSGVMSKGGSGIVTDSLSRKYDWLSNPRSEILGATVVAKGGDAIGKNNMQADGGYGISLNGNIKIDGASISATAGSATAEGPYSTQSANTGRAMLLDGAMGSQYAYSLSMKDSALNLSGGVSKGKNSGEVKDTLRVDSFSRKKTDVKDLDMTVKVGKAIRSGGEYDGDSAIKGNGLTIGGSSKVDVIGGSVDRVTAGGDTSINIYVPEGESTDISSAKVSENGKIYVYSGATVTENKDGTVTVEGALTDLKTGNNLQYKLEATVQPTCTTPGKRVYTCTTEGHKGETYEENIDALGHHFTEFVEEVAPTYTSEGYTIYKCANCDETEKRDVVPMLVPESNGGSSAVTLTVTGAGAYETSIVDGRYIIAVPAETAVLSGCLGNLRELKARDVTTIVFRTQLRETALNIDSMLSLGVDGTLFTLTHSGESAELTVGGFAHNELLH